MDKIGRAAVVVQTRIQEGLVGLGGDAVVRKAGMPRNPLRA